MIRQDKRNKPWIFVSCLICLMIHAESPIQAQTSLDIEGPASIKGDLSLRTEEDAFSIHIGLAAGAGTFFNENKYNTLVGSFAGSQNFVGELNTFLGAYSGLNNSNGSQNTFLGSLSGVQNTLGMANTFIGMNAGESNEEGDENTFVGTGSGRLNQGSLNTFLGAASGLRNTMGSENVFIGHRCGESNTTGQQNTLLGVDANVLTSGLSNAMALGYDAVVDASNKIRIGNDQVTKIEGQVNFTTASDRRFKSHIRSIPLGLNFVMDLRPVVYHRKADENKKKEWGLIAQEINTVLTAHGQTHSGMIDQSNDGNYYVRYNDLFAPLIKAIQELKKENDQLRKEMNRLNKLTQAISSNN